MKMEAALEGIRVLDFSQVTVGPNCGQVLGDLGADVIKIERIGVGELSRPLGAYGFLKGESVLFLSMNRNKRGVSLDLRKEKGKEIIYKLVEKSDVVVQNFRPGIMEKLGIGYEMLKKYNPKIIYASVSGYGLSGPYVAKAGQDFVAQGYGGIMMVEGDPNLPPAPIGVPIADYIGSLLLAQGITAALLAKERFGVGQEVDIALIDALLPLESGLLTAIANLGELPIKRNRPLHQVYKTKDGYITLVGYFLDNPLGLICSALGLKDLSKDPRFDTLEKADKVNARELQVILAKAISEKTTAECLKLLEDKDILCGPVNTLGNVIQDVQVQHNNMIIGIDHPVVGKFRTVGNPIRLSETPGRIRMPPPTLGQHNNEVLAFLGYGKEEIGAFRKEKVID